VLYGGPVPWTVGDSYIANIAAALTAQAARPPPPTNPPLQMKEVQNAQLIAETSSNDGSSSPRP
jgi:hypothetical protein